MRNRWLKLALAALAAAAPWVAATAAPQSLSVSTQISGSDITALRSRCPCSSLSSPEVDEQVRTRCLPICLTGDETIGTLP